MDKQLKEAINYYNKFSKCYDWLSPKWYYHNARTFAVEQLQLEENATVLNLPCGTGQNFAYFQKYLRGTGRIIGIDLSTGMLEKAEAKVTSNEWKNIELYQADATNVDTEWLAQNIRQPVRVDAVFCDLGLSGFPQWQSIIDQLLELLKPDGVLVIMDWYIPKPTLRGTFVKWIGKGEVDRPIYQYLEKNVADFKVDTSFNRGGVFVATGIK